MMLDTIDKLNFTLLIFSDECTDYSRVVKRRQCSESLPYTKTFFPNFIFPTQSNTTLLASRFSPIANCNPDIQTTDFICGLLNLECPAASASILGRAPCQHYCEEIANIIPNPRCSNIFIVSGIDLMNDVCPFLPTVPVDDKSHFCTYKDPSEPNRKSFF